MRRLLFFISLFFIIAAKAQTPFCVFDSVDINKYHFPVSVHGNMIAGYDIPHKGATDTSEWWISRSSYPQTFQRLWLSGYDATNNLKVSSQSYYRKDSGVTFWPGPLTGTGAIDHTTSEKWAKIWKVNGSDVLDFLAQTTHTTANTPKAILTWPGKGNAFALGKNGTTLNITNDMAPFVDINSNGIYEPLAGEYPDFPGDQVLWWVFNDDGPSRGNISGQPLYMEVHAMAYAYNRGTLIDNTIYLDLTLINRSVNNYHDVRLANFNDMDLAYPFDDYIGFDSTRRMGILYNGTNNDGSGGGHPVNQYGTNPSMFGTTMISLPGDGSGSYVPVGSFTYFNNDWSIIGNPENGAECNNYMRARIKSSQHFTKDFVGSGIPSKGYGSGPDCNYVFDGDLNNATQWSECNCANTAADRRYILSSNDFNLNAGSSQHVVMAYVRTDTPDGGCPQASFTKIRELADTAWNAYYNPPASLHRHTPGSGATEVHAYPNPAHDKLYIDGKDDAAITLYNAMGQAVHVPVRWNGQKYEVDISMLPRGLYNALYRNGSVKGNMKFMKE